MDESRFDAWTRRRFGATVSGALTALISLAGVNDSEAKKKRKKKKRCRKLGKTCGGKRKCCGSLPCETIDGLSGKRCCHQSGESCSGEEDCCGFLFCNSGSGLCDVPDSDRAVKANFGSVDPADMLGRVRALPISTWNYSSDDSAIRHIGPMAQDFAASFGVGADDRHIHPIDGQGVALAAIQGLADLIGELREENTRLAARIAALES
jgi:hypothetical protein